MNSDSGHESASSRSARLAALANELTAVVDQMEAEWRERGILSEESARELHALLAQAGSLFGGPVDTMRVENGPQKN